MSQIETLIFLLLLFMAVPDLGRKLRRPALAYPFFILFGLVLSPLVDAGLEVMLVQAGHVGLLLLLFEVGLEIDLPPRRDLLRALRYALLWMILQSPVALLLARLAGLTPVESLLAAAVLAGCSVGMAHLGWKGYGGMTATAKTFVLHVMISLEMVAIVLLTVLSVLLERGVGWWVPLHLLGVVAVISLVGLFAVRLQKLLDAILQRTTHWRVHLIVLLVLAVCALGERLGLSSAKTAFFLGLFMSRSQHEGEGVEVAIAPISRHFLIPLFFVSLGLQIGWRSLFHAGSLVALGTAVMLVGVREIVHRRWLPSGGDRRAFMLFGPNLTLVALGAATLLKTDSSPRAATWLLLSGFFLSVLSILALPAGDPRKGSAPPSS